MYTISADADVAHLKSEDVIVQYRAAAVQYAPFGDWDEDGPEVVLNTNFQTILQLANNASDQVGVFSISIGFTFN